MADLTSYEAIIQTTNGKTVIGYTERRSRRGLLALIQSSATAQTMVDAMPKDISLNNGNDCAIEVCHNTSLIATFRFSGRTKRTAETEG